MKRLKEAASAGEIKIALEFRTGAVGDTPAWQLVPILFDKFLSTLKGCKDLAIWEAHISKVSYEPFKKNAGGKGFSMRLDDPVVRIGE